MHEPDPSVRALWDAFVASRDPGDPAIGRSFAVFSFGDDPAMANELADLVVAGVKRATAPSVAELEAAGDPIPKVGDLGVVIDGRGKARCIVRTVAVAIVPYEAVSESFAEREGEGDKSLAYWRQAHWAYYQRILEPYGQAPTPDMPIVCESFEVVFRPDESAEV